MAAIFPPIPRIIFTVLEPISLVAGFLSPLLTPEYFVHAQVPSTPLLPITTNTHVVALQLGNVYLLMAFVGIAVLYNTKEAAVARSYILALLLGDVGHLAMTYYGLGFTAFTDIRNWNDMAWGNIGITAFLMFARAAYLLGLFGNDKVPVAQKKLV